MQYIGTAFSLAWPKLLIAVLWLVAGLAALWYARITRRPLFLFSGIAALLLSGSQILSPARLAYQYFNHRLSCASLDSCTNDLLYGAARFEWLIGGLAALVLVIGIFLEVAYARRRARANLAARAARDAARVANAAPVAAPPAEAEQPALSMQPAAGSDTVSRQPATGSDGG